MSDTKLKNNAIEAFSLIGISSGKKENVISDTSASLMNYAECSAVMVVASFLRDYLIDPKNIPS